MPGNRTKVSISTCISSVMLMLCGVMCLFLPKAQAQGTLQLQGDIGFAVYNTPSIARTSDKNQSVLPYLYADWGNLYARVDTYGYKVMPLGSGHLEFAARISQEGFHSIYQGIDSRSRPMPIGLGTSQETAYGAFFLYGFHDPVSGGQLFDGMYAAEFNAGSYQIYPQIGMELRSARYTHHLYAVSPREAALSGQLVYEPGNASSPYVGCALEYPLSKDLKISFQATRKWVGKTIGTSPLVNNASQVSGLIALTTVFK